MLKNLIFLILISINAQSFAGDAEKTRSIELVNQIVGVCQSKGMLACEPYIKGMDVVFEYIRLFNQVSDLDRQFKDFLASNYQKDKSIDFDVLQASLNLSLDITFSPEQFSSKITNAVKVDNGYDATFSDGLIFQLRKKSSEWIAIAPVSLAEKMGQLQTYFNAGQLKRSILVYRMLEAEMATLSKDKLEANISEDIAPILVALFGKEKMSSLLKWIVKDVNEVINFYNQFSTVKDMENHIIKKHNLT